MAQKGQGARALQLSFLASGVGGVIGVLLLIFLTPVLAQWALKFGPSHLFWIAILGVTIIGSLDSKSFVKGLLSGCLGLWLSQIGYDEIQGTERFIFTDALTGGIHIIPALIGLFAIPQVMDMLSKGRNKRAIESIAVPKYSFLDSLRELVSSIRSLSIGTVIGSVIGLIPGVGGQIAGLVAYDQSRKFSAEKEKFGTGHPEGVIAAESANNAMVGPSLVPLLTLSIPGSPTAAVLLGGLLIHGIFPGSDIFDKHPQVVWTFINSMLLGQILMVIFGIYTAVWAARIAKAPIPIMAAGVLVLAVFGSYSVQQSMGDVQIMFVLGVGMYVLEKFGFSAAPLVLGLILGPLAGDYFVNGSMIAAAQDGPWVYFFSGGLNLFLILLVLFVSRLFLLDQSVASQIEQKSGPGAAFKGDRIMNAQRLQHVVPAGLILLLASLVTWLSFTQEPAESFLFPRVIAIFFIGLAAWNFVRAITGMSRVGNGLTTEMTRNLLPGFVVMLIYVFWAAKALGFYTSSTIAFFVLYSLYDPVPFSSGKDWLKRLVITAVFMAVIYGLFALILQVQTPRGINF